MEKLYPWRDGRSVTQTVEYHRNVLENCEMVQTGSGYTPAEMRQIEARFGRAMPSDIRLFYSAAKPRQVGHDHWPSLVLFLPHSDEDVNWYRLANDRPHPLDMMFRHQVPSAWETVNGFMIGGTPFFDRLFIITGHSRYPNGAILLTDHEADSENNMIVVALSLANYIARLCFFDGVELVSVPGNCSDFPSQNVQLLAREIVELNPQSAQWQRIASGQMP